MTDITPHLRTQLGKVGGTIVLRVDVEDSVTGVINTAYLNEDALWHLADVVKNAIDAAAGKRIPNENRRKRWPARQGP